jgi:GT2 family glycosyltransferase
LNRWRVIFVPAAEAIHYGGASSANAPVRFFIEKQRANLQYWKKHHHWLAQQCYFLLVCVEQAVRTVGYASALCWRSPAAGERRSKLIRGFRCLQWLLSPPTIARVVLRRRAIEI